MSQIIPRERRAGRSTGHRSDSDAAGGGPRDAGAAASRRRRSSRQPSTWWFLVPAAIFFVFVVVIPGVRGLYYSLTNWDGLSATYDFVGLANFLALPSDALFQAAFWQTLFYTVAVTVLQTLVGLALALALNTAIRSRNWLRVLFFAPAIVSPVVVAALWKYIYAPDGPLDQILTALGLGQVAPNWLGDLTLAKWSVTFVIVWQLAGITMVIYLAGLQSIPRETIEASQVDGAGSWQTLRHITLPLLQPATAVVVLLALISNVKLFDQVWVMTGGGPGTATQTLTTALYQKAFISGDFGGASAIAVVVTVLSAVLTVFQLVATRSNGGAR
jgi:raffinose/stachyose/melibiose transport system permease protein